MTVGQPLKIDFKEVFFAGPVVAESPVAQTHRIRGDKNDNQVLPVGAYDPVSGAQAV
jgi:hypothetical protein